MTGRIVADQRPTPSARRDRGVVRADAARRASSCAAISKRFGATQALDDVSLDLSAGEVHALVGENGAGKSTLVKILAGIHQPDSGSIRLDGEVVELHGPAHARALGIAVVHQEPQPVPRPDGRRERVHGPRAAGGSASIDWGRMRRAAQRALRGARCPVRRRRRRSRGLSMADQQLIEIAKALSVRRAAS